MIRTAIDLFAGAGGFSLGVKQAGFNVLAAVEFDKWAAETYRTNHKDTIMIEEDITKLTANRLMKIAKIKRSQLDFLVGGPPCQGFTTINTKRSLDDPRSKLMSEFIRMVKGIQPKIFMIENVPGMFAYKDFFILLMETLEKCGYIVRSLMMDAMSYGVPQYRKRIFIQGVRKDLNFLPGFPPPTHFDPKLLKTKDYKLFTPATVAIECFAINGYPKEEAKDLYWNKSLHIQMNKKTAADTFDLAINKLIGEVIISTIQSKSKG